MGRTIKEFCDAYASKRFMITPQGEVERSEWLRKELEIKTYIPFAAKRQIAEMIVEQNIDVVDGIKKYDSINGYVGLIVASIAAHTNLQWSEDPVSDYDLLAESGLLSKIVSEFQGSHEEIDIILKMALAMEMEDNNIGLTIGRFLNGLLEKLGGLMNKMNEKKILGEIITEENLAAFSGFLDRLK